MRETSARNREEASRMRETFARNREEASRIVAYLSRYRGRYATIKNDSSGSRANIYKKKRT